jgi:hypothetical protein
MRRAVRLALLTVASTLTVASSAIAPLARAADEGAERDAQARFEEGLGRAKAGDFDAARISFTQAYAVLRRPRILWNLALSEEKTGHVLDALAHFKSVARDPSADEVDRSGAQTHVASLYGQTGHIEVRAPAGAPVTVDSGPVIGTAPLADVLDVAPGRHVVQVRLAQGPSVVIVEPATGEVVVASFLSGAPESPATSPGATAAASPAASPATAASKSAGLDTSDKASLAAHGGSNAHASDAPRIIVVSAVGGLAVAAVVLGVYFGTTSKNDGNTANGLVAQLGNSSSCSAPTGPQIATCSQLADARSSENRNSALSTGMYVTAAALAVGGAITWFAWPKSDAGYGSAARVSPMLGPGLAGLSVGMAF